MKKSRVAYKDYLGVESLDSVVLLYEHLGSLRATML